MFYTLLPLGGLEGNSLSPLRMSQTDFQLRGGKPYSSAFGNVGKRKRRRG
uniref:Uncharacterized protein n=1 Tax=Anguilla anguilla TaxID=7936 RepID=A0A0E9XQE7_ANGAN